MPVKRRESLSKVEAESLDDAFVAQLSDDREALATLHQKKMKTDPNLPEVTSDITGLAAQVAKDLGRSHRRIQNNMYRIDIPRMFEARTRFMLAVEDALREQFAKLGAAFDGDYVKYAKPFENVIEVVESSEDGQIADAGSETPVESLEIFDDWAHVRIGAWLADQPNPAHVDYLHHYRLLWRQDYLDYNTGDFYSIRRLSGWNTRPTPSQFLPYRESSERSFTFDAAEIRAFDVGSRKPLVVEPERAKDLVSHTHVFRVLFPRPIGQSEPFDIVYSIRLPGELEDLRHESEVMSISLARVMPPVDMLTFNVALSFEPGAVAAARLTRDGRRFLHCEGTAPSVEAYEPTEWFEEVDALGIEWSVASPYIIRWSTEDAHDRMYVINFRGAGSDNPLTRADRG